MFDVNLVAVLVATLVTMAVGSIWYSSTLFGSVWMRLVGLTEESFMAGRPSMWKATAVGFVFQFLSLFVLAHIVSAVSDVLPVITAVWAAVLVGSVMAGNVWWERRSFSYLWINMSYTLIVFIGGTCIITYWPW